MFITNLAFFYKMARIKNKPKEAHLELLRKELSKKHTHNILTSSDCQLLSDKMNNIVSSDTLRRLFNIIKMETPVSTPLFSAMMSFFGYHGLLPASCNAVSTFWVALHVF